MPLTWWTVIQIEAIYCYKKETATTEGINAVTIRSIDPSKKQDKTRQWITTVEACRSRSDWKLENLESLTRKRGLVKARITNFKTTLEALVNLETLTDIQIIDLQQKIERIKSLYNEFDAIQCQIECIADDVEQQYE
ncbi:hypothetical protein QE152_g38189 [Popillia japonica]|uniref:Uncharacterized protein n=1 Tax=Popillia japonica TaxID=7064 RepID=A0AAW1I8N8_POPJA